MCVHNKIVNHEIEWLKQKVKHFKESTKIQTEMNLLIKFCCNEQNTFRFEQKQY